MRKLVLLAVAAVAAVSSTPACADYLPMICEDRVWEYQGSYFIPDEKGLVFHRMKFDGSVVFNDKDYHCFRLYESTLIPSSTGERRTEKRDGPVFLLREEPGKVYALCRDKNVVMSYCGEDKVPSFDGENSLYEDFLIYDFTTVEGQTVYALCGEDVREARPTEVQWNTPVVIGGEKCRVFQYSCAGGPESNIKYVEGIGITANGCLPLFEPEFTPSIFDDSYDYPWRHSMLNAVYDSSGEKIYDYVGYGSKPLLKVGKVWVWKGIVLHEEVPVYFTVTGTEEIDGKSCFRVEQTSDIPELSGGSWLLCEEGGKVSVRYVDPDDNVSWLPLYGFSMTTGEEHQISIVNESGLYDPQPDNRWKVTGEENVHVSGVTRRMVSLSTTESHHKTVWVEGVGAPYLDGQLTWFWFPQPDNGIYLGGFKECIEDGEVIFSFADFGDPASVLGVGDDSTSGLNEDTVYDVMGRRVDATVPGSVYIRGGKKFVAR